MKKMLFILTILSALFALGAAGYVFVQSGDTNMAFMLVPIFISVACSNIFLFIKYRDKM